MLQEQPADLRPLRAQRQAYSDFSRALDHHKGQHSVDANRSQSHRQEGEKSQHQR